jgi:hypothetical protein
MSIAGVLELVAWILSAVIAAWLLFDMVRIGRTHDEHLLINVAEPIDAAESIDAAEPVNTAEPRPAAPGAGRDPA